MREAVAAAITGNAQPEKLEFLVNAQAHGRVGHVCLRFDLPPFAVLAQAPLIIHVVVSSSWK
jgi:hypothetical protein